MVSRARCDGEVTRGKRLTMRAGGSTLISGELRRDGGSAEKLRGLHSAIQAAFPTGQ
uniref:Uncharacterized protein n=1 Tax=Arundo donax TaxID=35708 RepID=A0A0A9CIZ4_ARUDO